MEYPIVVTNARLIKKAAKARIHKRVIGSQRDCLCKITKTVSTISPDKGADYIATVFEDVLAWANGRLRVTTVDSEKEVLNYISSCADAALNSIRS